MHVAKEKDKVIEAEVEQTMIKETNTKIINFKEEDEEPTTRLFIDQNKKISSMWSSTDVIGYLNLLFFGLKLSWIQH